MMKAHDPLADLRPLHSPPPVEVWPPAPGWWLLAALLLVVAGLLWWLHQRSALRRAALAELRQLQRREDDDTRFSAGVNQLLRRVALARFPREQVAGLSGEEWLRFLDAGVKGFHSGPGRALATAPYSPTTTLDRAALTDLARQWIRATCRRWP